jgi:hypothetical protein
VSEPIGTDSTAGQGSRGRRARGRAATLADHAVAQRSVGAHSGLHPIERPRQRKRPAWAHVWRAPKEFCVHIVSGAAIFVVLALVAVGLAFLVAWLKTLDFNGKPVIGELIIGGLTFAEHALFGADLLLLVLFLLRTIVEIVAAFIEEYWP